MLVEAITLYSTPLDSEYRNVVEYSDLEKFLSMWNSYYLGLESFFPKSISINKNIKINIKYSRDDLRDYNYLRVSKAAPSGNNDYFYFITSIDYNDTMDSYTLNCKYDDFMNNAFSFNNREMTLIQGHYNTNLYLDEDGFRVAYKCGAFTENDNYTANKLERVLPNTIVPVWLKIICNDTPFTSSSVSNSYPLQVFLIPYCLIDAYNQKILTDITEYKIYNADDDEYVTRKYSFFNKFTLPASVETSINDMQLTVFPLNLSGTYLDTKNMLHFNDIDTFKDQGDYIIITSNNSSFETVQTVIYKLPRYQSYYAPILERADYEYDEKKENTPYGQDLHTSYSLKIGAELFNLPYIPSCYAWKFVFAFNQRFNFNFKVYALTKDSSILVIPETSVENNFSVPWTVKSENQWFRNNKSVFNTNTILGMQRAILGGAANVVESAIFKPSNLISASVNAIIDTQESILTPIAKVNDIKRAKDYISSSSFYPLDIIEILDVPYILISSTVGSFVEYRENTIRRYGIPLNIRTKYKKCMSTYNFIKGVDCYLNDINDLESRKGIDLAINRGVTVWNYYDFNVNQFLKLRDFDYETINYMEGQYTTAL